MTDDKYSPDVQPGSGLPPDIHSATLEGGVDVRRQQLSVREEDATPARKPPWRKMAGVALLAAIVAAGMVWRQPSLMAGQHRPGLDIELIPVLGGSFGMGCLASTPGFTDDEKPQHQVRVADFQIGKYEVTQGQWRAVMGNNPSKFSSCGEDCPVEQVSWEDVQSFLDKLRAKTGKAYRLPTEAEWEYACRSGGKEEKHCGGDTPEPLAWYWDNSGEKTHPVGSKAANGLGLYDMSGNVNEWCSDWYGEQYYAASPQADPPGPSSGSAHLFRGGAWRDSPAYVRSTNREWGVPGVRINKLGFRLALSLGQ